MNYPCIPYWMKPKEKDEFDYPLRSREEIMFEQFVIPPEFTAISGFSFQQGNKILDLNYDENPHQATCKFIIELNKLSLSPLQKRRFIFLLGPRYKGKGKVKITVKTYDTYEDNYNRGVDILTQLYLEAIRAPFAFWEKMTPRQRNRLALSRFGMKYHDLMQTAMQSDNPELIQRQRAEFEQISKSETYSTPGKRRQYLASRIEERNQIATETGEMPQIRDNLVSIPREHLLNYKTTFDSRKSLSRGYSMEEIDKLLEGKEVSSELNERVKATLSLKIEGNSEFDTNRQIILKDVQKRLRKATKDQEKEHICSQIDKIIAMSADSERDIRFVKNQLKLKEVEEEAKSRNKDIKGQRQFIQEEKEKEPIDQETIDILERKLKKMVKEAQEAVQNKFDAFRKDYLELMRAEKAEEDRLKDSEKEDSIDLKAILEGDKQIEDGLVGEFNSLTKI